MKYLLLSCVVLTGCIPVDKQLHLLVGASTHPIQRVALPAHRTSALERCALSIAAGVGKEVYDSATHGRAEALDVVATVAGCLIVDFVLERLNDR